MHMPRVQKSSTPRLFTSEIIQPNPPMPNRKTRSRSFPPRRLSLQTSAATVRLAVLAPLRGSNARQFGGALLVGCVGQKGRAQNDKSGRLRSAWCSWCLPKRRQRGTTAVSDICARPAHRAVATTLPPSSPTSAKRFDDNLGFVSREEVSACRRFFDASDNRQKKEYAFALSQTSPASWWTLMFRTVCCELSSRHSSTSYTAVQCSTARNSTAGYLL